MEKVEITKDEFMKKLANVTAELLKYLGEEIKDPAFDLTLLLIASTFCGKLAKEFFDEEKVNGN